MTDHKAKTDIRAQRREKLFRHIMVIFLAIVIMGFFAIMTVLAKPLDPIKRALGEFSFTDIYYEILGEGSSRDTSRVITIVDLTNLTRRADIARTLEDIEACHPKVIGLDCCFDNVGEDFEGNDSLIRVAETYKNIVFAVKMEDWAGDSIGWTKPIHSFFYDMTPITEGTVNVPRGLYDRVKRKIPLSETCKGKQWPSFVAQVSRLYGGRDAVKGKKGDMNINFSPTVFRQLSPDEVRSHPELIEDQIVLFGSMHEDIDKHWTPIGKIAGVELLAYGVQTVIYSREIKYVPFIPFCIITLFIIFLVQVVQTIYLRSTGSSRIMFVRYVIGSPYFLNILTFLFLSVFIGISFLVFRLFNVSFNMAWAIAVIAFLGTSRSMYDSIREYVKTKRKKYKLLKGIRL